MPEDCLRWLKVHCSDDQNPNPSNIFMGSHIVQDLYGGNHDLNHGYRGPYAYLLALISVNDLNPAVSPTVKLNANEQSVPHGTPDYAAGTGGWYRYVYGEETSGPPIKRIKLFRTTTEYSAGALKVLTKYEYSSPDLNSGRGWGPTEEGTYLYLLWD